MSDKETNSWTEDRWKMGGQGLGVKESIKISNFYL